MFPVGHGEGRYAMGFDGQSDPLREPYPVGGMRPHPVSTAVNNPKNDAP